MYVNIIRKGEKKLRSNNRLDAKILKILIFKNLAPFSITLKAETRKKMASIDLKSFQFANRLNCDKNCKNAKSSALQLPLGSHVHVLVKPNFFHSQSRNGH